ncbi:hypothetical protein [Dactylosporangium sp. CS-033363]|uniref:hypothetical protein n=1 Tax=Dactylosporangium sp. CS-033363 TaxID=3239935 RepID=UPI003D9417E8
MSDVSAPPPVRPLRELLPNLVWEVVLLLAAIGLTIALYNRAEVLYSSGGIWLGIASLGFATSGLALSLRTGTPNLAVGPLAGLAMYLYVDQNIGVALIAVLGAGVVLALLAGLTGVPAWAVTLVGGLLVQGLTLGLSDAQTHPLRDRPETFWTWGAGFIVVSIAGGVVFAIPPVRRFLTANRPGGGEAGAFSGSKFVGALVGVVGSSFLAGLAGVVLAMQVGASTPADNGFTLAALVAAMLAGVSPFGRRAGILGVVLAVVILDAARRFVALEGGGAWVVFTLQGLLGLLGVLVVWIIELIGRRASPFVVARPAAQFAAAPGFPPPPQQLYPPAPGQAPPTLQAPGPWGPPTPISPAAAPPVSAPPTSAPPVSAPPMYVSPSSAPPSSAPPVSAPPTYGPPSSAPPAFPPLPGSPPPQQSPSWPATPPQQQQPGPSWPPAP